MGIILISPLADDVMLHALLPGKTRKACNPINLQTYIQHKHFVEMLKQKSE